MYSFYRKCHKMCVFLYIIRFRLYQGRSRNIHLVFNSCSHQLLMKHSAVGPQSEYDPDAKIFYARKIGQFCLFRWKWASSIKMIFFAKLLSLSPSCSALYCQQKLNGAHFKSCVSFGISYISHWISTNLVSKFLINY